MRRGADNEAIIYNNIFITDFQEKVNFPYDSLPNNDLDSGTILRPFILVTEEVLPEVTFDRKDISRVIKSVKPTVVMTFPYA